MDLETALAAAKEGRVPAKLVCELLGITLTKFHGWRRSADPFELRPTSKESRADLWSVADTLALGIVYRVADTLRLRPAERFRVFHSLKNGLLDRIVRGTSETGEAYLIVDHFEGGYHLVVCFGGSPGMRGKQATAFDAARMLAELVPRLLEAWVIYRQEQDKLKAESKAPKEGARPPRTIAPEVIEVLPMVGGPDSVN